MRQRRFAILVLLVSGICVAGLLLLLVQPNEVTDVCLFPRGMETNSAGTLCLRVAVTNSGPMTFGIGFAIQTKLAGGWEPASTIKHFNVCSGETLQPRGEVEVLVPVPQTRLAWRVAAAYYDKRMPADWLGRYWRTFHMRFSRGHGLTFVTTPEIASDHRAGVESRRVFQALQVAAASAGCCG